MINYKDYFKPLPDLKKYLNRIFIEESRNSSLDYLDELILAHQYAVPFENIDIFDYKKQIEISTDSIFDKVVKRNRGGYCFELNTLFYKLLLACGYEVYPTLARVVKYGESYLPSLHRLTIIKYDNSLYVCDVGFGSVQPGFALKIEGGLEQTSKNGLAQTFKVEEKNGWWKINYRSKNSWENTIMFNLREQEEVDFVSPNYYTCNSENAIFTQKRMVNLRTENGNKSIDSDTFIQIENHQRIETPIEYEKERNRILEAHFGIRIGEASGS